MRFLWLTVSALALVACSDSSAPTGGSNAGGAAAGGESAGGESAGGESAGGESAGGESAGGESAGECVVEGESTTADFTAGGDRPVQVEVPDGYDANTPAPLLILLHGYTVSGATQEAYFQLASLANDSGMVYAHPDGMTDANGSPFWNASDACCDFAGTGVDDSAYLGCLIEQIRGRVNIDPSRIYFVGHSNGGFMSYRMACDHASTVAAIVSLAGAMPLDLADCGASEPVSVLQIHGDADATILYSGGSIVSAYPSAAVSIGYWAELGGCAATPVDQTTMLDLDTAVVGNETTASVFEGCDAGIGVELWTLAGSGHIPGVTADFRTGVVEWLLAHPKP